jgi:hypothetical protein
VEWYLDSFNLLKLPDYGSKSVLLEKLQTALRAGASGFHLA